MSCCSNRSGNDNHDNNLNESNDNNFPSVLSPSYFALYDQLSEDAAQLGQSRQQVQVATEQRQLAQERLKQAEEAVTQNRAFAKEQEDRIRLVSTHWFYGTTALQPQLWWRGGCPGKIRRAEGKLERAQQERPNLVHAADQIRTVQLPPLERQLADCVERRNQADQATAVRDTLKQRAIQQYPSPRLGQLEMQETLVKDEMDAQKIQERETQQVLNDLARGPTKSFQDAQQSWQSAQEHCERYQSLKSQPLPAPRRPDPHASSGTRTEEILQSGKRLIEIQHHASSNRTKDVFVLDRHGKVEMTNFPCPNNCGYLITWHPTHCCQACQQGNPHHPHGPNCSRKPIESQQGARDKLREHERRVDAHQQAIRKHKDQYERELQSADGTLRKGQEQAQALLRQLSAEPLFQNNRLIASECRRLHELLTSARFQDDEDDDEDDLLSSILSAASGSRNHSHHHNAARARRTTTERFLQACEALKRALTDHQRQIVKQTQSLAAEQRRLQNAQSEERDAIFERLRQRAGQSEPPPQEPCGCASARREEEEEAAPRPPAFNPAHSDSNSHLGPVAPSAPLEPEAHYSAEPEAVAVPDDSGTTSVPFAPAVPLGPSGSHFQRY